ncbi:class I adenylate-forming enzyme family protein [Mycobacterium sp. pV006]|uniref:class I adenylate-forming enzyme family protein n=1 Tax=Mycobacterium sp. pV006 TaxID=3238983 RepID=UPI00351ABBAF
MAEIPLTVGALLARAAENSPQHTYVVSPDDRLTFAEAERRSALHARWLMARGVGKGTRVGLFFPNGTKWVSWWLAVSRIGAVAVPLSTLYPAAELAKVVRLADVAVLVAPERVLNIDVAALFEQAWPELAGGQPGQVMLPEAPFLRTVVLTGSGRPGWSSDPDDGRLVPHDLLTRAETEVTAADLAIMVHTSGSTADPKGVLHTHGTLSRQTSTWPDAIRAVTGSSAPPVILCAMPFFWIGGVLAATGALHDPVTLLVLPRLEPAVALDLIEAERATGVVGWPAFTQRLREHPDFDERDLSSAPLLRDGPLDIAMTDVPDGFPVHRTMSETAGGFAYTDMQIVDDHGVPVEDGTVGELWVRGIGVMAGYNKRERADTFDADGWYHTGDRVYRKPGDPRLFYVGRNTDMIKTSGANVSPLEVEAVIETFDDVAQCVVVGVDHPDRGEEVCAVVVPAAGAPDTASLRQRTAELLSSYKVPTRWVTATGAQIPTLPSGKLDRKALRAWVGDGASDE